MLAVEELGEFGGSFGDEFLDGGRPRVRGRPERFEQFGGGGPVGGVFREAWAERFGKRGLRGEKGAEREDVVGRVVAGRAGDEPRSAAGEPDVGRRQLPVRESGAVELGQVGCDSGGQPEHRGFGQCVGYVPQ